MNESAGTIEFPFEITYRRYLDGLLTNNLQECRECFEQWLAATPDLRSVYDDLVRRSLYEVGTLWEQGKISVATEHMATAISESLLNLTYPRLFAQPRNGKSALVTCVANEYHQIGGRMVADVFELHGWRGYFLGANTPLEDLNAMISQKNPDVVAFSLATVLNLNRLLSAIDAVRETFSDLPILLGGQAMQWLQPKQVEILPGVKALKNLTELEAWIDDRTAKNYV
jgi:MerR family transcriptional regulator, light-induced transcriptional regulator